MVSRSMKMKLAKSLNQHQDVYHHIATKEPDGSNFLMKEHIARNPAVHPDTHIRIINDLRGDKKISYASSSIPRRDYKFASNHQAAIMNLVDDQSLETRSSVHSGLLQHPQLESHHIDRIYDRHYGTNIADRAVEHQNASAEIQNHTIEAKKLHEVIPHTVMEISRHTKHHSVQNAIHDAWVKQASNLSTNSHLDPSLADKMKDYEDYRVKANLIKTQQHRQRSSITFCLTFINIASKRSPTIQSRMRL